MSFLASWPLRRLLLAGFALLMAALIAVAAAGIVGQQHARGALGSVYKDRTVPLGDLGAMHHLLGRNRVLLSDAVLRDDGAGLVQRMAAFDANLEEIDRRWNAYLATTLTDEERQLADALRQGDFADTRAQLLDWVGVLAEPVDDNLGHLVDLQVRVAADTYQEADALEAQLIALSLALSVAGVVLGAQAGLTILRTVGQRLGADPRVLSGVVQRIAGGDLAPVEGAEAAPASSVLAAMAAMRDNLARIVGQVRSGSDSIATASSQIAQRNQDLSSRTEQQAS